ncbi:DUF6694 family lipoprotein [Sphingomicrobium astaxanthinifaciens]|uniref:DUF6694 family lipoprotein n=1 Tax=Sphingomicrobium astaxanthinifaciens TaxID=1227949 RepID=UPI001FCBE92F|nr:DUF6694 family lipoprotein [Sphingomicrobium astaxanthinifaciens]MCJ7421816.1 hypothetical protein [Sphingomicrobium astaxanthinifaciens]
MLGIALLAGLAACEAPEPVVIDGSSEEAFAASAAAARAQLPMDERLVFDRALNTFGARSHREKDVDAYRRRTFDGMTAQDVVADARARGLGEE